MESSVNTSPPTVSNDYGLKPSAFEFYLFHSTAGLLPLTISLVPCVIMLSSLLLGQPRTSVFKQPIGVRLTVYLALCDLLYTIQQMSQHGYALITLQTLPAGFCSFIGSCTFGLLTTQSLLVLFIATNSFVMVVKGRKIRTGDRDRRLLCGITILPIMLVIMSNALGFIGHGPHGLWCMFDTGQTAGVHAQFALGINNSLVFMANAILYGLIWTKLRSVQAQQAQGALPGRKYDKLAKVLSLYVVVYLIQWVPGIVYVWMQAMRIHTPFPLLYTLCVFVNLGGLLNCIAYTFVRKRATTTKPTHTGNTTLSRGQQSREYTPSREH